MKTYDYLVAAVELLKYVTFLTFVAFIYKSIEFLCQ